VLYLVYQIRIALLAKAQLVISAKFPYKFTSAIMHLTTVALASGTLQLAAYITLFQTSFCVMDRAGINRHTSCQTGALKGLVEQRRLGRKMLQLMAGTTMNQARGVGCR
jgi:hypothetical protein